MNKLRKQYIAPILVIIVGIGRLLNVQGIIPKVDWVWTCALATTGILTIVAGGLNKLTVVVGLFLIVGSICSILRQTSKLSIEQEAPILTIALGILLLFVHILKLPTPEIMKNDESEQ
jgi:hypothetical protein